ncbi:MAG: hypothetical protein A3F84_22715 [Candidatus Handelsmanbacteria bacterium RIFCSPLOWO2_12_FULL_64_10]|uniref:DUF4440 domain-containing protein n=1 Tax=Handelsmanbacteria sp. (strain RIFCSPLOWO2_12_FULL_64_10) TaxID=1817868 RepID=A0A1F6C4M3_HANXR|nr:MAG: hypothetical protein A3F84_22715 [Candidatus Handelsmanbacteria bacterium RIFCSPLOWO2_12_FULL_64_10]
MRWRWALISSAFLLIVWGGSSQGQWFKGLWGGRTLSGADIQEIASVRAVLEREFDGHLRRDLDQVLSCYADNCVGYYADGSYDPRKWSVGIAGIKDLRSSKEDLLIQMKENQEIFVTHARGDEVQHVDVKGNFAAAASRHYGAATNKETGEEVRWDWINFWTLAKIGGQWKITGFISQVVSE